MRQFNFRLFLRPTAVGKIIIDRLTSEGVDRQADARRWMELGYMCEQAGFRVDGSTLFQAGRPAAAEQLTPVPVIVPSAAVVAPSGAVSPSAQQAAPAVAEEESAASAGHPIPPSPPPAPRPAAPGEVPGAIDSVLTSNLRNLAH